MTSFKKFFYFWLCWVFIATCGLSLAVAGRGCSLVVGCAMLGGRDGEEGAPWGRGERGPFSSPLVSSSFRPVGPGTWQNPAIQLRAKEVAGRRPGLTEPRAGAGRAAGVRPGLPTPPGPRSSSRLLHPWGNLAPLALVRRPRGRPSGGLSWAPCVHGHVWLCNPMDCSPPG